MSDSPYVVTLDESNLIDVVVEGSVNQPVLVDFWADWCGPCKTLMPILEKLADEYQGGFILAKLNADENQELVQQMGVRGLPTCRLFINKQAVDEFSGALPEAEVRKFLDQHVTVGEAAEPAETEAAPAEATPVDLATAMANNGDTDGAKALLKQAQADDPSNTDILIMLGQLSVADNELDAAQGCLQALSDEAKEEPAAKRLAGTVALAEAADMSQSFDALSTSVNADGNNSEARYQLAIHTALQGELQGGMDHLLEIVKREPDFQDGAARKQLLSLFDVLGSDPLAGQYRRKMFALLH